MCERIEIKIKLLKQFEQSLYCFQSQLCVSHMTGSTDLIQIKDKGFTLTKYLGYLQNVD